MCAKVLESESTEDLGYGMSAVNIVLCRTRCCSYRDEHLMLLYPAGPKGYVGSAIIQMGCCLDDATKVGVDDNLLATEEVGLF